MRLLLDVGNSRLKWALTDGAIGDVGVGDYDEGDHAWARLWSRLPPPSRVDGITVAPLRVAAIEAYCRDTWGQAVQWHKAQAEAFGLRNRYEPAEALGADRYAALVAVRHRVRGPACIVSCGTAITVDALSGDGVFAGGVILPGLRAGAAAIDQSLPHLRVPDIHGAVSVLARSTGDGLVAGLILGAAAAIDRIVDLQCRALGAPCTVFLSGGDSDLLKAHLNTPIQIDRNLPLHGLAIMTQ